MFSFIFISKNSEIVLLHDISFNGNLFGMRHVEKFDPFILRITEC